MIADTTFIIDLMNNDERAVAKLQELIKRSEPQSVTALTIFELFSGLARCNKPAEERNKIMKTLSGQLVVHLDSDSAEKGGEIDGSLIKEGKGIDAIDCMIAGIALIKNDIILTRNVKDFSKIKGLNFELY